MSKRIISSTLLNDGKKTKASFKDDKIDQNKLKRHQIGPCETSSPEPIIKLTCKITLRMSSLTGSVKD